VESAASNEVMGAFGRYIGQLATYFDRVIVVGLVPGEHFSRATPTVQYIASTDEIAELGGDSFETRSLVVLCEGQSDRGGFSRQLSQLYPRLSRGARVAIIESSVMPEAGTGHPQYAVVRKRLISFRGVRAKMRLLRPIVVALNRPSLSVVVPARNERGNIAPLFERMPRIAGADTELVFVEGGSTDGTWEEINRACEGHAGDWSTKVIRQTGRGKADAVRLGVLAARGHLVTILDADLTMPPELLPHFYEAYVAGYGDFINGSRLTQAMEPGAMRRLNKLGNRAFALLVSWVLDIKVGDCLCGTKLFPRYDFLRFLRWRDNFGKMDPFGDFDLLFAAAELGVGIVDVSIPYRARTYGETNIHRFRDGAKLLRMCVRGLVRIKWGSEKPLKRISLKAGASGGFR
jgi:glycosyltransferase involved in cell wall biosynthesis